MVPGAARGAESWAHPRVTWHHGGASKLSLMRPDGNRKGCLSVLWCAQQVAPSWSVSCETLRNVSGVSEVRSAGGISIP